MSVLVYTENWDGRFKKQTFEIVSYAATIAEQMGSSLTAVSIGEVSEDELQILGKYGASRVLSISNDKVKVLDNKLYTSIIAEVAKKEGAKIIVLANNNLGKALAPRLSVRLKAGLGSGVSKLPLVSIHLQL